jgi:hypothetical protein
MTILNRILVAWLRSFAEVKRSFHPVKSGIRFAGIFPRGHTAEDSPPRSPAISIWGPWKASSSKRHEDGDR